MKLGDDVQIARDSNVEVTITGETTIDVADRTGSAVRSASYAARSSYRAGSS